MATKKDEWRALAEKELRLPTVDLVGRQKATGEEGVSKKVLGNVAFAVRHQPFRR